jgi:hypothetical protein
MQELLSHVKTEVIILKVAEILAYMSLSMINQEDEIECLSRIQDMGVKQGSVYMGH